MLYCGGKGMDCKELRKLRRKDLLEILLEQTKRIEELELELEKTKEKLNDKKVLLSNVGSLAEASLKLSDIFKAADEAIAIQMKNIEEMAKNEEKRMKKELRQFKKIEKEKFLKKNMSKLEEKKSSKNIKEEQKDNEVIIKKVSNNQKRRKSK